MTYIKKNKALCLFIFSLFMLLLSGCASNSYSNLSGDRKEVVMQALSQIGTPYRYGGSTPKGFDCSGLVQYAHKYAGISTPRSTLAQQKAAKKISKKRLKPGDLVFFKTGRSRYHVGIMVDKERFVHAPSSGKDVRTSSLNNRYWSRNYIGAGTYLH